jgi:Rrf2 family protein
MRLFSEKVNYCLQALIKMSQEMTKENPKIVIQVKDLADSPPKIPKNYLLQLLILLKNKGIIDSERGKTGGYKFLLPPQEIHVIDIIEAVEGPLNLVENPNQSELLTHYWSNIEQKIRDIFTDTLKDIIDYENRTDYMI